MESTFVIPQDGYVTKYGTRVVFATAYDKQSVNVILNVNVNLCSAGPTTFPTRLSARPSAMPTSTSSTPATTVPTRSR